MIKKEDGLETFYLTFGSKYPWKRGWVEVRAVNYQMAKKLVVEVFGDKWAWLFSDVEFKKEEFPAGKIGDTMY